MEFESRYSLIDRLLHRLAFASRGAQVGLADLEGRMFRDELAGVESHAPVFVTALPRAGTTILLELLASTPTFATHTYRDLPFVLCPLLWARFAGKGKPTDAPRERAHGDGLQIHIDSPEAFEEMVWLAFHRKRYRGPALEPYASCADAEFVEFFREHQRRIIALRRRGKPTASRYVSKNNLNVARLPAIWTPFPDACVIVPFREPLQHAASLQRQHARFLAMHAEDAFARRYMAGIGHFDFGANLKPIDFGGWFSGGAAGDPQGLEFWLRYWLATYRHVLRFRDDERLMLVEFEELSRGSYSGLLERFVGIEAGELDAQRSKLREIGSRPVEAADSALLVEAGELHGELVRAAAAGGR